jgi:two-component system sensor histidine kinase UhpB
MQKKKILIIGDDVISAKDTARFLRGFGHSAIGLIPVDSRTLKVVEQKRPHLVLVDIGLHGGRRGVVIAARIHKELDLPVLIFIDPSGVKRMKKALARLSCGFLLKPVDARSLELAVETTLARSRLEKKAKGMVNKALRKSEERYLQLVDNISEGVVIQDKKGIITSANKHFLGMIGYRKREVIGRPILEFLGEGWLKKMDQAEAGGEDRWKSIELAWKKKDGKRVYTILSRKPILDPKGRIEGSVSVLTDITDRREVEIELRRSREELRNLSRHIQAVREKESKRIAGEIHDVLGQQLTALKIDLSWIGGRVASLGESGNEIQSRIGGMSDLVDKTIESVQKISAELRPVLLDDLGLGPAIEWLAQDFENRTNIKCLVRLDGDDLGLDPDCATAIFRISQEALTNVARHARATAVGISLGIQSGALFLKISDNGKGIVKDEIYAPSSLGLMGMRERIRTFGGNLELSGGPDKGTELTVAIPLEKGMMKKLRK